MATLPQIRQRLRDWAVAREQNAHDEITAAFAHVHQAIADLTEHIEPEPDPDTTALRVHVASYHGS